MKTKKGKDFVAEPSSQFVMGWKVVHSASDHRAADGITHNAALMLAKQLNELPGFRRDFEDVDSMRQVNSLDIINQVRQLCLDAKEGGTSK